MKDGKIQLENYGIPMTFEPFYSPNARPKPARKAKSGEKLFEFRCGMDAFVCELRDHGEFGVEAQCLRSGELYYARMFRDVPEFGMRARQLAIAWAEQERPVLEQPEL